MSFSPETEQLTQDLIQAEFKNACEQFGEKYNSLHEGYAVLLEEVEEVEERVNEMKFHLEQLWASIKNDAYICESMDCIKEIEVNTFESIKELAQVGAVLQKIQNTLEVEE